MRRYYYDIRPASTTIRYYCAALRTDTGTQTINNTQPRDAASPMKFFRNFKCTTRSQQQVGRRMPVPRSLQTDGHPNIIMPTAPSIGGTDVENVPEKIPKKPSKMWKNKRKTNI